MENIANDTDGASNNEAKNACDGRNALRPIHLTLYRGARSATPERSDDMGSWENAIDSIKYLVEGDPDEPGATEKTELFAVGPYRLKPGTSRADANVEAVTMMAIDVDACDVGAVVDRITELGIAAAIYGSPSDDPDGDQTKRRVRVLAPIDREILPSECKQTRIAFAEMLGLAPGCGVEEALDPSRLFFAGRLDGTPERDWADFDGAPLQVDSLLQASPAHEWKASPARSARSGTGPSTPSLDKARILAQRLPPSIEGAGGDEALMIAARELATVLGPDADAVESVLAEVFNPRCVPPWDSTKIRREAEQAAGLLESPAERWKRTPIEIKASPANPTAPSWTAPRVVAAGANDGDAPQAMLSWLEEEPPIDYYCEGLRLAPSDGKISVLAGDPGGGKGPIANHLAMCFALGLDAFGDPRFKCKKKRTLLIDFEGARLSKRRIQRMCAATKVDPKELEGELLVWNASSEDLTNPVVFEARRRWMVAQGVEVVVLDSYTSAMLRSGVDSAKPEYALFAQMLGSLNLLVLAVAHVNKNASRQGGEPNLYDIANSGAFGAMAQTAIVVHYPANLQGSESRDKELIEIGCARAPEERFMPFQIRFSGTKDQPLKVRIEGTTEQEKKEARSEDEKCTVVANKVLAAIVPGGRKKTDLRDAVGVSGRESDSRLFGRVLELLRQNSVLTLHGSFYYASTWATGKPPRVRIEGDQVIVTAPQEAQSAPKGLPGYSQSTPKRFLRGLSAQVGE